MNDMIINLTTSLPGFLLAISCHEAAHAYMAYRFGDDTAYRDGRVTLNPMVHYDLMGTIIFPLIGILIGGVMFGWAKPVPFYPSRTKNIKKAIFWVGFAGPLANIILAIISALLFAIIVTKVPNDFFFFSTFIEMLRKSLIINVVLAVFNLIPFPPLDGSKMVSTFLNYEQAKSFENLQRYSFIFILILWFTNIFQYLMMPAMLFANSLLQLFIRILA